MYDKKLRGHKSKQYDITLQIEQHSKADESHYLTAGHLLDICKRAKTIFDNSSEVAGKRTFLNYLLQNPTLKGKEIAFTLKKPFDLILNLADLKSKTASISANRPSWLRTVDEVRTSCIENLEQVLPL